MFNNLGFTELALIMGIALIVFGPSKLPELGKSLGSAMREFKKATQALTEEVQRATTIEPEPPPARPAPPAPAEPPPEPVAGSERPAADSDKPAPDSEKPSA